MADAAVPYSPAASGALTPVLAMLTLVGVVVLALVVGPGRCAR